MISDLVIESLKQAGCEVKTGELMSCHTSFKIGGAAELFVTVRTKNQLSDAFKIITNEGLAYRILGNGSNLLVSDSGIGGAVIKLDGELSECEKLGNGRIKCGAGMSLAGMCKAALDCGLTGLEFAWGIPGTVGGGAYMNAGAYGGEMKDVIETCECMNCQGEFVTVPAAQCDFGYRHSVFAENGWVIVSVTVALKHGDRGEIKAQMDDIFGRRKAKQPLELPSAGSVFKRPEGYFAGGLIEQCGLKGSRVGGAQVSEKHAGFIVNTGGATCCDVLGLIERIQKTVKEQTGVELECEIKAVD